jgi:alpha-tubulin suppressor-like RCC1 family protein
MKIATNKCARISLIASCAAAFLLCFLASAGTVNGSTGYILMGVGWDEHFQLGDGTNTPVPVKEGAVKVAAGGSHSLCLDQDGVLWGTGDNYYGQLGDGTFTDSLSYIQIDTDVTDVAACVYFTVI